MADNRLYNKYLLKNTQNGTFQDVSVVNSNAFKGVKILSVTGLQEKGKAKNVYTASWEYEDTEDFEIVMEDSTDEKRIIRENVDITVTFAVRRKYADIAVDAAFDARAVHDAFVNYMTDTDVWIRSVYAGLQVHCVCIDKYEPTMVKLKRGAESCILGSLTMHCIEKPTTYSS